MASNPPENSFSDFFKTATSGFTPYGWQVQVAVDGLPEVLPVPTGLGKTEVALAWAWRLLVDKQPEPLHLVVCLPMRSLVTQTVQRLKAYFDALRANKPEFDVGVHQLMGGAIDNQWVGQPDEPWILVGTQDQLLSRALNRGYSMSRFEWPVHFGLLNNDCRWLIDEVQLMGPGLWTTAQLDWMRKKRFPSLKSCSTTWMSATVAESPNAALDLAKCFVKSKIRNCRTLLRRNAEDVSPQTLDALRALVDDADACTSTLCPRLRPPLLSGGPIEAHVHRLSPSQFPVRPPLLSGGPIEATPESCRCPRRRWRVRHFSAAAPLKLRMPSTSPRCSSASAASQRRPH